MKKIIPVLLIAFLSSSLAAQDNAISKYFSDYMENPTFDKFIVSEKSFELFEEIESETTEEQQVLTAIADLEGIIALVTEKSGDAAGLYRDAANTIAADGNYEELVTVENKNTNVKILLREELDQIRIEMETAHRAGDLQRMSELQYGRIPELEKQLADASQAEENGEPNQLLRNKVTENEIADVVSAWTGIPVSKMMEGERDKLMQMEELLKKRVIGQQEAIQSVSNAIRRSRAGLSDPNRPMGSFMFLGPTGVGKTELSKALADFLFDDDDAMVRIDMSEFMEKHSVSRLVGAPPGYVGYEEGGYLTEAVRRKPYSVILLDEVEKAHPDVFNILLQVLDDGRLTDGQGRTVDFTNSVIIMTSNLGSDVIQNLAGEENYDAMQAAVMEIVGQHFRPEFINRVDDAVVFHPLDKAEIRQIAEIQLGTLVKRLAERDMTISFSDEAMDMIADAGFDPVYGARPLKRAIQQEIENPLATKILSGAFMGGDEIKVHVQEDQLIFDK